MLPLLHPPPLCVLRPPFCNSSSGDGVQRGCSFCAPLKRTHGLCACVSLNEVGGRSESLTWASISGEHAACRSLSQRFQSSLSTSIICDKWDISAHTHTHTPLLTPNTTYCSYPSLLPASLHNLSNLNTISFSSSYNKTQKKTACFEGQQSMTRRKKPC